MNNWIDLTNFTVAVSGLLLAVMGCILNLSTPYAEKWNRRFYMVFFPILIAYIASDLIAQISLIFLGPDFWILSKVGVFLESFFSSILMLMLTVQILHYAGLPIKKHPVFRVEALLWLAYFLLLLVTQFTDAIYTISPENEYSRGPYYFVLLISPLLMTMTNIIFVIIKRDVFSRLQIKAFLVYLLIPLACTLIQMFSYGLLMIMIGTSIAAILMFSYLMTDIVTQQIRQSEENVRLKTETAMLQMRPHFIYNTMTSIYYLCAQDPGKAQKVTYDFTTYLRKNFSAISTQGLIPFEEELVHTRAYLAVEMVRFEDKLNVEFDTPCTDFSLPPLTLQPIVENAVKYGADPEYTVPLQVRISTEKTEEGILITVEDSGPGIDNSKDSGQPHTAIRNIKERLALMCKGTLTIQNGEHGGTKAEIFLPKA